MDLNGSAKFKSVPIIDVTKENVAVLGPMVRGGVIGSDFIAIDCVSIRFKHVHSSRYILRINTRFMNSMLPFDGIFQVIGGKKRLGNSST